MSGYTNSATFDDGSDLFMDEPENTTQESPEPEEHESTEADVEQEEMPPADPPADPPAEAPAKPTVRIVYDGEERELTYDEAVTLAQKGLNTDRAIQRMQNELAELDKWAQQAGMSRAEYVQYLQTTRRNQAVSQEIASIREKYPDIPEEAAKEMAEARIKDSDAEEQRAAQERRQTEEAAAQEPWIDFVRRYPDMSQVEKIPAEVLAEIENGARPVEAMQRYETKELQKQIADLNTKIGQLEQNKKNKDTALPAAGNSRDDKAEDPFLAGLGL